MKIINLKTSEIIPYEKNPRINSGAVDKTVMSIKEYGWQQPIVVDKNKIVIAGHTRLKAAIKMGASMYKGVKRSKQAMDATSITAEGQNLPERSNQRKS